MVNSIIKHLAITTIGLYEEYLSSDSEIPVRTTGVAEAMVVARKHLIARNPDLAEEMKAA